METDSQYRVGLCTQIREAYGRLVYTYTTQLKMANRLTKYRGHIKFWQIFLSALSTTGFIGAVICDEMIATYVGATFSAILLALNLYTKNTNLVNEILAHRRTADKLWFIREEYISLLTDFSILSDDEIVKKRDSLSYKTGKVYETAPLTDQKSYCAAQKALKNEEEQFFTPQEIDRMLPAHLRIANCENSEPSQSL